MTIGSLKGILEQLGKDDELAIAITLETGESTITYDVGFDSSDSGEFMLTVHI